MIVRITDKRLEKLQMTHVGKKSAKKNLILVGSQKFEFDLF